MRQPSGRVRLLALCAHHGPHAAGAARARDRPHEGCICLPRVCITARMLLGQHAHAAGLLGVHLSRPRARPLPSCRYAHIPKAHTCTDTYSTFTHILRVHTHMHKPAHPPLVCVQACPLWRTTCCTAQDAYCGATACTRSRWVARWPLSPMPPSPRTTTGAAQQRRLRWTQLGQQMRQMEVSPLRSRRACQATDPQRQQERRRQGGRRQGQWRQAREACTGRLCLRRQEQRHMRLQCRVRLLRPRPRRQPLGPPLLPRGTAPLRPPAWPTPTWPLARSTPPSIPCCALSARCAQWWRWQAVAAAGASGPAAGRTPQWRQGGCSWRAAVHVRVLQARTWTWIRAGLQGQQEQALLTCPARGGGGAGAGGGGAGA